MLYIYLRHAYPNELYHHGIKGQKWGVRRFQNPDGTLTTAGRKRYYKADGTLTRKGKKEYSEQHAKKQREEAIKQKNVNILTKQGFRSYPGSDTMEKRIKTKNGLTHRITVDATDEPINDYLLNSIKKVEKNIDKIERDGNKAVYNEIESRMPGESKHLTMLRGPYIQLNNHGAILSYDGKFDNGWQIYPWAEYDPLSHKIYRVAIDD